MDELEEPLDIVRYEGNLYSLSSAVDVALPSLASYQHPPGIPLRALPSCDLAAG